MKRVFQFIGIVILLVILTGLILYAFTPRDKLLSYIIPEISPIRISNLQIQDNQASMQLHLKATSHLLPVFINKLQYNFKLFNQSICQGSQNFTSGKSGKVQQITLPIRLNYAEAFPLIQRQIQDSVPVRAGFQMLCRVPVVGSQTFSTQNNLPVSIPLFSAPQITNVAIEDLGFQHGRLVLTLTVTNPNNFDYYIRNLSLNGRLADYQAEASNIQQDYLIRAKQVIPIRIISSKAINKQNNSSLFRANSSISYQLKTAMIIEPVSATIGKISFQATSTGSFAKAPEI